MGRPGLPRCLTGSPWTPDPCHLPKTICRTAACHHKRARRRPLHPPPSRDARRLLVREEGSRHVPCLHCHVLVGPRVLVQAPRSFRLSQQATATSRQRVLLLVPVLVRHWRWRGEGSRELRLSKVVAPATRLDNRRKRQEHLVLCRWHYWLLNAQEQLFAQRLLNLPRQLRSSSLAVIPLISVNIHLHAQMLDAILSARLIRRNRGGITDRMAEHLNPSLSFLPRPQFRYPAAALGRTGLARLVAEKVAPLRNL